MAKSNGAGDVADRSGQVRAGRLMGLVAVFLAVLAAVAPAEPQAEERRIAGPRPDLAPFMETYYQSPNPQGALQWLAEVDLDRSLSQADEAQATHTLALLAAFYAHVIRQDDRAANALPGRLRNPRSPTAGVVGAMAAQIAGTDPAARAFDGLVAVGAVPPEAATAFRTLPVYPYPAMAAQTHLDLDLFWTSFFATGDPAYVEKIAEALAFWREDPAQRLPEGFPTLPEPQQRLAIIRATMGVEAYASLRDRAQRHPAVTATLRSLAERQDRVGYVAQQLVDELDG